MENKGYGMEPAAYHVGYDQAAHTSPQPNSQLQIVTVQPTEHWRWCTLVTSVISVFLCSCCGIPAMVAAIMAYSDHKARDYERAHNKYRFALGCGITGIVVGAICIIVTIAVYSAFVTAILNEYY